MKDEAWIHLLGADPRPWLLGCDEPATRRLTRRRLLDQNENDPHVRADRQALLEDGATADLLARLPDWETHLVTGHQKPDFAPNLLNLLADMGLQGGDHPAVERLLDAMLAHQERQGRFASFGKPPGPRPGAWGAVLCDHHAISEVLLRFGRGDDPRMRSAIARMAADLVETDQGLGWRCVPHSAERWRGPGRKAECCPQVCLEALRVFSRLRPSSRPDGLPQAARLPLRVWRQRHSRKPYMFGHGRRFKIVKWAPFWYGIYQLLDAVERYPELWRGPQALSQDRQAIAELAASLQAYNFQPDGRVIPRSIYMGFSKHSFGQKKRPSPWATACLCVLLRRFDELVEEIEAVDALALPSTGKKGGKVRGP